MKRLAIISTHPIQYNVPWFRHLATQEGIEVCVFYTWHADEKAKYDPHFDREIAWDIPLLNGYDYQLVAPRPTVEQKTFWNLNSDITGPIKAWGADAILVLGWNYRSHLRAMRYFSGRIQVYFRGDSTLLDTQNGIRRRLRKLFLRYVYSCVDTAFFVGINNYDYFQKYGLKQTQLTFAPHAIDNQRFSNDAIAHETEASQWRTSLGIPADSVVFLFVGKLIQKKVKLDFISDYYWLKNSELDINSLESWSGVKDRPLIIAGPCSAETEEQMMTAAKLLAEQHIDILRKPL